MKRLQHILNIWWSMDMKIELYNALGLAPLWHYFFMNSSLEICCWLCARMDQFIKFIKEKILRASF